MEQDPKGEGDRLSTIRGEIQFENSMLTSRLSAYLTSQSFIMIAFAGSVGVGWSSPGIFMLVVPLPLCVLGLFLSIDAFRMIGRSYRVIESWHRRQTTLLEADPDGFSIWLESVPGEGRERVPPAGRDFRASSGF